jgi:spermidine synthase
MKRADALVLASALLVSGAAALVEQVLWGRQLQRLLGSTALATAVVLAGFLGGLGAGGFLAGRWRVWRLRPLERLGQVEIAAGAAAALFTVLLDGAGELAAHPYGPALLLVLQAIFALPLGAGFPMLVEHLMRAGAGARRQDRDIARYYGVNALGGCAGSVLCAFVLVPRFGEQTAIAAAVVAQAGAGLAILALGRRERAGPAPAAPAEGGAGGAAALDAEPAPAPAAAWSLHALVFGSGLVAIYWEVLFTRILVLVVGSSVYAFAVITAAVLAGIGAMSLAGGPRFGRRAGLGMMPIALAWLLFAGYFLVPRLPDAYVAGVRALPLDPLACGALGAGALVFLPSFLIGAIFPWSVALAPRRSGLLLAVNAAGATAGAFLAALAPDLESAFREGILGAILLGCLGYRAAAAPSKAWIRATSLTIGLVLAVFVAIEAKGRSAAGFGRAWDLPRLLSGVYAWPRDDLESVSVGDRRRERDVLVLRAGREAIVTIERDAAANTIYVKGNGRTEGSVPADPARPSRASLPTQLLLAAYPAMLRPGAAAAVIGLGSGVTVGAAARLGFQPLDVLEIEPAFLDAIHRQPADAFFAPYFSRGLAQRSTFHFGDARRLLLGPLRDRRWDVLISQPSEPWIAASAALFTREFFDLGARRLSPDGVFVQWLQLYKIDLESLRLVARTFARSFDRVFLLRPPATGEIILIGSRAPIAIEKLLGPPPEALEALAAAGIEEPADLLAVFLLGPDGVRAWVDGAGVQAINVDRRNLLEFRGPRFLAFGVDQARRNLAELRRLAGEDPVAGYLPPSWCTPERLRRLAARNARFGDFEEALALIRDDATPEAASLRGAIEAEMEAARSQEAGR